MNNSQVRSRNLEVSIPNSEYVTSLNNSPQEYSSSPTSRKFTNKLWRSSFNGSNGNNDSSFSIRPKNEREYETLSAWDNNDSNPGPDDDTASVTTCSTVTINGYDDDTASVTTCSTATTSDLHPREINVSLDFLKNYLNKERRKSVQNHINKHMSNNTTSIINKGKQKIVDVKDEIVESTRGPSQKSVKRGLSSSSVISNDSSTIKDNNSSCKEEISEVSITHLPEISKEVYEAARVDKQKKLLGWVKILWPQLKLPGPKQISELNPRTLSQRNLNPLVVGIIERQKPFPKILAAMLKGTRHPKKEIGRNGQIKFKGEPVIVRGTYDPKEYILWHCPTFHNPPCYNNDPRNPWPEQFLLNKVLPRLTSEATRVQNEVGLFLTVKETLLRGLDHYSLYQCKFCEYDLTTRNYTYLGICEHLQSKKHNVRRILEEEMIRVSPKDYIEAFYENLPPMIVYEK